MVAKDSVENLTSRLRGQSSVAVEIEGRGAPLDPQAVVERLGRVPGVSNVLTRDVRNGRHNFEVETGSGADVRPELARAVVEAGWNLNELRTAALSLEEVFLELTASEQTPAGAQTTSVQVEGATA